jgi:hypothetical protein
MLGKLGRLWPVGVLGVCCLLPGAAGAWPLACDGGDGNKCPKPSYSPLHYWVPSADRFYAFHCRRVLVYIFPKDSYPGLPIYFIPIRYKCPPVPPAVFTSNYPWFPQPPGASSQQNGAAAVREPGAPSTLPPPTLGTP